MVNSRLSAQDSGPFLLLHYKWYATMCYRRETPVTLPSHNNEVWLQAPHKKTGTSHRACIAGKVKTPTMVERDYVIEWNGPSANHWRPSRPGISPTTRSTSPSVRWCSRCCDAPPMYDATALYLRRHTCMNTWSITKPGRDVCMTAYPTSPQVHCWINHMYVSSPHESRCQMRHSAKRRPCTEHP